MRLAKYFGIIGFVLVGLLPIGSRIVRANGEEFFEPPTKAGPGLVYFGLIKDSAGKPIDDVELTIGTQGAVSTFLNDAPGHFRSPDVGADYKNLGEKIDPTTVMIGASKAGYAHMSRKVPTGKADGSVEVDIIMTKDGEVAAAADGSANPGRTGGRGWTIPVLLVIAGLITVVAVRTSTRRRSTGDSGRAAV